MSSKNAAREKLLSHLRSLNERVLHTVVVLPLFKAMGFRHVQYVHGAFERGKDILYCTQDSYDDIRLEVCQVKNTAFTGKATSRENTNTVLSQLKQCREYEVLNPELSLKERPQGVVLLTTYPLPDKDLADAGCFLRELRKESIKVIPPDKFIDLIEKHLPDYFMETVSPGHVIFRGLLSHLNKHQEHAAFEIMHARELNSYFVNLSMSPSGSVLSFLSKEGREILEACFRRYNEVASPVFANVTTSQQVLPEQFQIPALAELTSQKVERNNEYEIDESSFPSKPPKVDQKLLAACYRKRTEVVVRRPQLDSFVEELTSMLNQQSKNKDPESISKLIDNTAQCIETLRHFCAMGQTTGYIEEDEGDLFTSISEGTKIYSRDEFKLDLSIRDVSPLSLTRSHVNLCIIGEAGSGKTTTARAIAISALQQNDETIYFPCSSIRNGATSLKDEIEFFLEGIVNAAYIESIEDYLRSVKLIIIDGIDEARNFAGNLSKEIAELAFYFFNNPSVIVEDKVAPVIPTDLLEKVEVKKMKEGYRLTLKSSLSFNEQKRLELVNEGISYQQKIRSLFEGKNRAPRVIVTMRKTTRFVVPENFCTIELLPMSDAQMEEFFHNWFINSDINSDVVIQFMEKNPRLKSVCRTPIVATIVASIHEREQPLPRSKTEVYEKRFQLLLGNWDKSRGIRNRNQVVVSDKLIYLAYLAFELHAQKARKFTADMGAALWEKTVGQHYQEIEFSKILVELIESNNVIVHEGSDKYSLGHLSYQEYLAALGAVHKQKLAVLVENSHDPWWREVIIFFAGITGDASDLLSRLVQDSGLPNDNQFLDSIANEGKFTDSLTRQFIDDFQSFNDDENYYGDEFGEEDYSEDGNEYYGF